MTDLPRHLSVAGPSPDGPRDNEDAVRVTPTAAVVVDGAGVPQRFRRGCHHSVAWFASRLADAFITQWSDPAIPPREALAGAIAAVRTLHPECSGHGGSPSATIAAVRTTDTHVEHLVLCDASVILVDPAGRATRLTDLRIDDVVRRGGDHRRQLIAAGLPPDEAGAAANRFIESLRNHADGFWVGRSDPAVAAHALVGRTPLDEVSAAIVCTDGITRALDRVSTHTLAELAGALTAGHLDEVVAAIRTAEADGAERPGKVHDDASVAVLDNSCQSHRVASQHGPDERRELQP